MSTSLRFALRSLGRTPGFTALVVLCLALGIGVNVAFLRVIDLLLLRPPAGVHAPATLYRVESQPEMSKGQTVMVGINLSRGDLDRLAARREVFAQVAGYTGSQQVSLGSGRDAREIRPTFVDGAFFAVVGTRPLVGRLLGPADAEGDARVVALGERLWRTHYGSDPAIVGRRVRINGEEFEVVGVTGGGFTGLETEAADVFLPITAITTVGWSREYARDRETRMLDVVARLAPSASVERATAVATTVLRAAPVPKQGVRTEVGRSAVISPVTSRFSGMHSGSSPVPTWLLGATAAVLLVACANVANLLLARGETRRRELATRSALGATRTALVRQLLVESALLAAMGGVVGLLMANAGTRAFALLPGMPPLERTFDPRTVGATLLVSVLTTVLCGLVPALQSTRADAAATMRAGTRIVSVRTRWRGALMAAQLAAALALLAAGGVFVRSLRALQQVDAGFDLPRLVTLSVDLAHAGMGESERAAFAERAIERLRALPGVTGVSRTMVPMLNGLVLTQASVEGVQLPTIGPPGLQLTSVVSDDYFETVRLPLRRGRGFTAEEARTDAPVLVVSEAFAKAAWKDADPIGQCVRIEETTCTTVIGVAADAPVFSLRDTAPPFMYRPLSPENKGSTLNVVLHASGDPAPVARAARAAVQGLDGRLPFVGAFPLVDGPGLRTQFAPYRLGATAFSVFGILSLLVAAVGLYAVVAYAVARRTGEIGVRIALGATGRSISTLVLGDGLRHAVLGCAGGIAAGAAATHALRAKLYGVAPFDVPTFAVVTLVLLAVALLASWLPARRAATIPPTEALRSE